MSSCFTCSSYRRISFVGEGESGCVVSPHIPCDAAGTILKIPKSVKTVGKIFKSDAEFHEELEMVKRIQAIDTQHKWTAKYFGHCDVSKSAVLDVLQHVYSKDNDMHHVCFTKVNMKSKKATYKQIIYEHAGVTLQSYISHAHNTPIQSQLLELFKGCEVMMSHGIFMNDIKEENISFDKKKKRMVFIDFGGASYIHRSDPMYMIALHRNISTMKNMLRRTQSISVA